MLFWYRDDPLSTLWGDREQTVNPDGRAELRPGVQGCIRIDSRSALRGNRLRKRPFGLPESVMNWETVRVP